MRLLTAFVDWRRALLLLPVLVAAAAALYFFGLRDGTSATPRASLLDTPSQSGLDVGTKKGQLAHDFLAYSPEGEMLRLSDLRGTPVVINFWATWCTSCLAEMPDLRDLQAEVGAENLRIVAINAGESSDAARRFLDVLDAPAFRVGMDPSLVVADAYAVRGMPQSVFIDSEGVIRAIYIGQLDEGRMREYLRAAQTGTAPAESPPPLRFLTTVARERVLEVERLGSGRAEFRSKSLRCDDSYCAEPVIGALEDSEGVVSVERHLSEDPPRVLVTFDEDALSEDALVDLLVDALERAEDPLYASPIDVRQQ